MFTLFALIFALFFIGLALWTISTLLAKSESRESIKEELRHMFDITKMLLISIRNLSQLLRKASFPSNSDNASKIDEQFLKFVPTISDKKEDDKAA